MTTAGYAAEPHDTALLDQLRVVARARVQVHIDKAQQMLDDGLSSHEAFSAVDTVLVGLPIDLPQMTALFATAVMMIVDPPA